MGGRVVALVGALAWLFAPVAAAQPVPTPLDGRPVVVAVELHLPYGMAEEDLKQRVTVRRGDPLSPSAVSESIRRIFATNRFADVVAKTAPDRGGVRLIFELVARQCIEAVLRVRPEKPKDGDAAARLRRTDGPEALSDQQVVAASGLGTRRDRDAECPEEAEYYPDRERQAVEGVLAKYHEVGRDQAQVELQLFQQSGGLEVRIKVDEGPPTRIAAVNIAGHGGLSTAQIITGSKIAVGGVLELRALDDGMALLRDVYREKRYFRARLGEPKVQRQGTSATITLPIEAGPHFSRFHFHGNRSFPDTLLEAVVGYDGSEPLDETVQARLQSRLREFYRARGFTDVRVGVHEVQSPDGAEAVLAFEVEEGPPLFVEDIELEGNQAFSTSALRDQIAAHVRSRAPTLAGEAKMLDDPLELEGGRRQVHLGSPLLDAQNIYSEPAYEDAVNGIAELYRNRGYDQVQVTFEGARIDVPRHTAVVKFKIVEGPVAIAREVTVKDMPAGIAWQKDVVQDVNEPLNAGDVERSRSNLTEELQRKGYLFAAVNTTTSITEDGRTADVEFTVDRGPEVRISDVRFTFESGKPATEGGLGIAAEPLAVRSEEKMLRAIATVRAGEILTPNALFETQRYLLETGAFRQVGVRVVAPDTVEEWKDVEVVLRESARYSGELAYGYSLADGPRVVVDASAPNLGGSGVNASARGKLNYVGASSLALNPCTNSTATAATADADGDGWVRPSDLVPAEQQNCLREPDELQGFDGLGFRVNVSFAQPRVPQLAQVAKVTARSDLVAERIFRPSYSFTRFAGIIGGEWDVTESEALRRSLPDALNEALKDTRLNLTLQYELEHDRVYVPRKVSEQFTTSTVRINERFQEGNFTLQNFRSALTWRALASDEEETNPQSGVVVSLTGEVTRDLLATHTVEDGGNDNHEEPLRLADGITPFRQFTLKTSANVSYYLKLTGDRERAQRRNVVLALSARAGRIAHLGASNSTVIPKRFFLGGFSTLRGFREDSLVPEDSRAELRAQRASCEALAFQEGCSAQATAAMAGREPVSEGGELFALFKSELRIPLIGSFDLGLFFEAGNLWSSAAATGVIAWPPALRYVAGAGVRYSTPIGPLAFDLGVNLFPDVRLNEQPFNFHFSIGLF